MLIHKAVTNLMINRIALLANLQFSTKATTLQQVSDPLCLTLGSLRLCDDQQTKSKKQIATLLLPCSATYLRKSHEATTPKYWSRAKVLEHVCF